jgi:hypothetical protein
MFAFHIVESLARLYPDPSGLLASFARDLFDILEPYFPIHFTHVSLTFHIYFSIEHLPFMHSDCYTSLSQWLYMIHTLTAWFVWMHLPVFHLCGYVIIYWVLMLEDSERWIFSLKVSILTLLFICNLCFFPSKPAGTLMCKEMTCQGLWWYVELLSDFVVLIFIVFFLYSVIDENLELLNHVIQFSSWLS